MSMNNYRGHCDRLPCHCWVNGFRKFFRFTVIETDGIQVFSHPWFSDRPVKQMTGSLSTRRMSFQTHFWCVVSASRQKLKLPRCAPLIHGKTCSSQHSSRHWDCQVSQAMQEKWKWSGKAPWNCTSAFNNCPHAHWNSELSEERKYAKMKRGNYIGLF